MTTCPSVTWPSPPRATPPSRRTERIVVPWNVSIRGDAAFGNARGARAGGRSGGLANEMPGRDADQQQQRADDGRSTRDLHGLALTLDPVDAIEQRARAHEVDALDRAHVDRDHVTADREVAKLHELAQRRAGEHARPHQAMRVAGPRFGV